MMLSLFRKAVGYGVVVGFGVLFSVVTTAIMFTSQYFGNKGEITSEHFK
jgi:urea-proton symporter